jgi:hypothetical protein
LRRGSIQEEDSVEKIVYSARGDGELIVPGGVVFNVIRTLSCERTPVWDAAKTYRHTHWDFTVEVNFQPALVSYKPPVKQFDTPVAAPGLAPGITDIALLNWLLQPRGYLAVTAGNALILEAPDTIDGVVQPCDVMGGPSVEMCSVPVMIGVRHWVVVLRFVADVRDPSELGRNNNLGGYDLSLVISNLWVSTETIDYQRRSVRQFAGRAILRADVMRQARTNANAFRDLFLFKCPDHYQRENVTAALSEDGTICDWSFTDRMRGYDLSPNSPIVSLECFRTGEMTAGSPFRAVMAAAHHAVTSGWTGLPQALFAAALENLPKSMTHCRCDLVGDRNANLGQLSAIAMGVVLTQLGLGTAQLLSGTARLYFSQDIGDQVLTSCEVTYCYTDSIEALAALRAWAQTQIPTIPLNPFDWTVPNLGNVAALMGAAALNTMRLFMTDNRTLPIDPRFLADAQEVAVQPPPPGVNPPAPPLLIASRQGDQTLVGQYGFLPRAPFAQNPPLRQGAYGVVPQNVPGTIPPVPGAAGGVATGVFPAGIEALIVQALIGQDEATPIPTTLNNLS